MSILFTSGKIGSMTVKNRIIRSATAERLADDFDGHPKPGLRKLWTDLARGGTGLIITGHMYVHPSGKCHPEMTGIYKDDLVPSLANLVEAVHKEGGKIAAQINHGGMQCAIDAVTGTIAPSAITEDFLQQPAREISEGEIEMLIAAYAQSALRVKHAGFDGVQLHGAHGYLINQFISPFVNHRTDKWGGNFDRRIRFLEEVSRAVRVKVGPDYPVFIKFGMEDGLLGGLSADEGCKVLAKLRDMGLDGVEISGGICADNSKKGIKSEDHEAYYRPLAQIAKKHTNLPIILVGGIRSRGIMEQILESGDADFVSMCRPLINDPNFPNLLRSRALLTSECISSNNCWAENLGEGIACKCPKR
jgi:2,4-dienoyl-CoA reductase-like NADH-dependent reductase (Old Yellow Enzyme family)